MLQCVVRFPCRLKVRPQPGYVHRKSGTVVIACELEGWLTRDLRTGKNHIMQHNGRSLTFRSQSKWCAGAPQTFTVGLPRQLLTFRIQVLHTIIYPDLPAALLYSMSRTTRTQARAASSKDVEPALQPAGQGNTRQKNNAPPTGTKRTVPSAAPDNNQQGTDQPSPPKKAKTQQKKVTKASTRSKQADTPDTTANSGPQLGDGEAQDPELLVPEKPKRKRRTKAEMEAARAQEAAEKQMKEDAEKARRQELEDVDRQAHTDRQTLGAKTVYCLVDVQANEGGSEEEFPEFYEVHGSSDEEDTGSPKSTYQKLKVCFVNVQ